MPTTDPELRQVGPRKWVARPVVGYRPGPAGGYPVPVQRQKTFHGTKTEARAQLREFMAEVLRSGAPAARTGTLESFLERWITHVAGLRESSTARSYRSKIKIINRKLGHVRLDRLDAQAIDRAYAEWLAEGKVKPQTVRSYHRVLSAALHQAVKWDLIPSAPTEKASPPSGRPETREAATIEDTRRLITTAQAEGYWQLAALISLAATTGMRRGELCGLRWSDVKLDKKLLWVRRSIKAEDIPPGADRRRHGRSRVDGFRIGDVKNHRARPIALDDFALAALEVHRRSVEAYAETACTELAEDPFVFTLDPTGLGWYAPDTLSHHFDSVRKIAGVTTGLHQLRHAVATQLIANNFDVRSVAARLGNGVEVTLRTYSHALAERDQVAAQVLGQLVHGDNALTLARGA